jgi:hypothetical protein
MAASAPRARDRSSDVEARRDHLEGHGQFKGVVGLDASCLQRTQVAIAPQLHLGQGSVTEEGEAPAAQAQQVLGGKTSAEQVVATDAAVPLLRQLAAPQHHRHLAGRQFVEPVVLAPLADDDQADGIAAVGLPLSARDTVETETPARRAMSAICRCLSGAALS